MTKAGMPGAGPFRVRLRRVPVAMVKEGGVTPPPPYDEGADPVQLAAATRPMAGPIHRVCTVGALSWCSPYRWARPSTSRVEWPLVCERAAVEAEFAGDAARVQLVHFVVYIRGLALFLRRGAFSSKRLFRLAGAHCQVTTTERRELRRVFAGRLPTMVCQWPLEK